MNQIVRNYFSFFINGIYGSAMVEITGRRTWKQNLKQTFDFAIANCPRYGPGQYSGKQLVVRRYRSDVFTVIFEISRHLFLVFLLLTLNIVFFWLSTLWAKLHNCNLLSYRNETPPETSLGLCSKANLNACEWHSSQITINSITDIF